MRNLIFSLAVISAIIIMSLAGCKKEKTSEADTTGPTSQINKAKTSVLRSQAYNDTLVMYYDTAAVRQDNPYLMHWDNTI